MVVFLLVGALPLVAQGAPIGDSSFDGYSWSGAAGFTKGGSSSASFVSSLDCPGVYSLLSRYQEQPPNDQVESDRPSVEVPGLSSTEAAALAEWPEWTYSQLETRYCLDVNLGWLTASGGIVSIAQNDGVAVNVVDGATDCAPGELLFASAHYYWDNFSGSWAFGYGTNPAKVINSVTLLEITGSITFQCAPIFNPDVDVADFASGAPAVQVNHNPLVVGLTGLDTWFWYDFSQPSAYSRLYDDSVSVDAYGKTFTLAAEIWMDGIDWDVDCVAACGYRGVRTGWNGSGFDHGLTIDFADTDTAPAPAYDGGDDTENDAAGEWLYEEKGTYTLSTASHWRGVWTFNGLTYFYPPVVISDQLDYVVQEVRGVLTTRDD